MITIKLQGGLCNQIFQIAFLEYASQISGNPFYISDLNSPTTVHGGTNYYNTIFKHWKQFYEKKDSQIILRECPKMRYEDWKSKLTRNETIMLFGYFQRHEYILPSFIDKLSFNTDILNKYPDISSKYFIHIRGGDYINNPFHELNLTNYYNECIKLCNGHDFVIFTNDIPFANNILPGYPVIQENEIDSLFLMSKCAGCICVNSSFSWWGAFLNKNRPIYFPSKWFNDPTIDISGFYFKDVNIIRV